ncbi:hypothetical protein NKI09_20245 [Mesorhizobium sp. M0757]|uniref:hypothetical protein n=1 Tax=unclassified Mesorhizobium TaxID=325217 RepID=UPI003337B1FF
MATQLVFSGPLLLACLAVAAPGRLRFSDVSIRAGAQFRLAHLWGGQIVPGGDIAGRIPHRHHDGARRSEHGE